MSSPFFQSVDPSAAPGETSGTGPADAAGWDQVTPSGMGPAAYDISAPQDIAEITGAAAAATALTGVGGPRQSATHTLLASPQGFGEMSVTPGFPDYESADVAPGAVMENPIQGMGDYPGTTQDGISQYGMGGGIPGVTPETGSMDDSSTGYPGTTQDGVPKYGTS